MKNAYELIEYNGPNFRFSVSRLNYVAPHMHREIEFGLCLQGDMIILAPAGETRIHPGQFWYLNPGVPHEIFSSGPHSPYLSLHVQFSAGFFRAYFPQMDRTRFEPVCLSREALGDSTYNRLRTELVSSAISFYRKDPAYPLICAAGINSIMAGLLTHVPFQTLSDDEIQDASILTARIQRITEYISSHSDEKLLLSDLAGQEGLSLHYLSHFFTRELGMPFQTYLKRIRCRSAAVLLLNTRDTLSDISLKCGFSALKYMRAAFQEIYGCTPEIFRELYHGAPPDPAVPERPVTSRSDFHVIGRGFTAEKSLRILEAL